MLLQNLVIFRQAFLPSAIDNKQKNMFNNSPCIFIVDAGSTEGTYLLIFPMAEELVTKKSLQSQTPEQGSLDLSEASPILNLL